MEKTIVTKEEIKNLVDSISYIQQRFTEIGESTGNSLMAFQNNKMLEMFKNILYFAWEKYGFGWHSDFRKGGDSMIDYMMFELRAQEIVNDLITVLQSSSPFEKIEKDGAITNSLIAIYSKIINDLSSGNINL